MGVDKIMLNVEAKRERSVDKNCGFSIATEPLWRLLRNSKIDGGVTNN
jgi:hypothetical protein